VELTGAMSIDGGWLSGILHVSDNSKPASHLQQHNQQTSAKSQQVLLRMKINYQHWLFKLHPDIIDKILVFSACYIMYDYIILHYIPTL